MDTTELKQAVRDAAKGDETAAASLFDHYHPRVFRYALAKLRRRADAEDVAAETFARVLRDLDRFKWRGGGFEAWIFTVASNLVVDHVRRSGREVATETVLGDAGGPREPTPEDMAVHSELSRELRSLLEDLVPEQREVLLLRFAAGLDTKEAGEVMGRKPNAVRQLQFRALANLRSAAGERFANR